MAVVDIHLSASGISCDACRPFPLSFVLPHTIKLVLRQVAQTSIKFTICAK